MHQEAQLSHFELEFGVREHATRRKKKNSRLQSAPLRVRKFSLSTFHALSLSDEVQEIKMC
jgi:hypothetical protein